MIVFKEYHRAYFVEEQVPYDLSEQTYYELLQKDKNQPLVALESGRVLEFDPAEI